MDVNDVTVDGSEFESAFVKCGAVEFTAVAQTTAVLRPVVCSENVNHFHAEGGRVAYARA